MNGYPPTGSLAGRLQLAALAVCGLVAFSYIVSAAYLGLGGSHEWRQALTYGHILGFTGVKDFAAFDLFTSGSPAQVKSVYDIPLYQLLVAKASLAAGSDPLVTTRYVNLALWLLTAFAGYGVCRALGGARESGAATAERALSAATAEKALSAATTSALGGATAGLAFVFLLATSPLILHYYSVPLPDTLAIALALAGMALLHRGLWAAGQRQAWLAAAQSAPLLLTATFVKSPVVFPFILFYMVYAAIAASAKEQRRDAMRRALPVCALLLALLAAALLAEQLRFILLGQPSRGIFAQGADAGRVLFFGAWELRASKDFWNLLWQRAHAWGPFAFGSVFLAVTAGALVLQGDRQLLAVTVANVAAFLGGWLTLSQAYYWHDYYQLPLAVIAFIAFGVSLSRIATFIGGRLPSAHHGKAVIAAFALAALALLAQFKTLDSLSDRSRATLWDAIEHGLRNETAFLYVRDTGGAFNPAPGGLASAKFRYLQRDEFEANCERYLAEYPAVVSQGMSACLAANRLQAHYYIEDDGLLFYLNKGEFVPAREAAAGAAANDSLLADYDIDLLQDAWDAQSADGADAGDAANAATANSNRLWTISAPGDFDYRLEQENGKPVLRVTAGQDLPWLAIFLHRRDFPEGRRYHRLEVEASAADAALALSMNSWDFTPGAPVNHIVRPIALRQGGITRQSLPLDFTPAAPERDYADIAAAGIKANQTFTIHTLRLYSSNWPQALSN